MPDIKLTEKQKEVVKAMREGKKLNYWAYYNNTPAHYSFGTGDTVRKATVKKLIDNGLIEPIPTKSIVRRDKTYTITELGKNIKL